MDQERARIQDDLRGLVSGDVRCDDVIVQLYASDASLYQIRPLGVVLPRTTDDVVACIQYAAENRLPVHPRGAGTGLAGESLGPGLILDFSKYLRRVLAIDDDSVRIQPGVVHERLNNMLRPLGRQFGPDPAMSGVTTMGSVIAIDAAGSHWLKHGSARRHVRRLKIVLADGQVMEVGREPIARPDAVNGAPDRKAELVARLADLIQRESQLIARHQPKSRLNRSGYQLDGVLADGLLDLPKLLSGSEGTLAAFVEATVATQHRSKHRGVALLFFDRLEAAARTVLEVLKFGPSACDLMDRRHLSLAREADVNFDLLIPAEAEAMLLVEQEGDDPAAVRDSLQQIVSRVTRKRGMAFGSRQAFDNQEIDLYWRLARKVVPTLHRLKGQTRPLPFVEDMAVPPEALPAFLVETQNILKRHQVTASLFGHAGHGQLHLRPFLDLSAPDGVQTMQRLADELYDAVLEAGGSISGEHGDGLSRTQFVRKQYGPLYEVFREIKRIFDPDNILNPGKIINDDEGLLTRNLRPMPQPLTAPSTNGAAAETRDAPTTPRRRSLVEPALNWSPAELSDASRSCNGCGACRAQSSDVRMCPIFRFSPREEASPRAKANLVRGILSGELDAEMVDRDEFKAVADLCVHCQMCRLECPAGVDIPKLMVEAKAAYVSTNGLSFGQQALARIDALASLASLLSPLSNWAIANRQARWLLEKLFGIAQARKLPRFSSRSFVRRAMRRRLTRPTRRSVLKVLYFVDTYANFCDPDLAEAFVRVLEHNGVSVFVPPSQWASGMPMIAAGAIDRARNVAAHNVPLLAEAVRQGFHIVATEPAAALSLIREYPNLLDDEEARLVAANTSEACTYLWRMHSLGKLKLDFRPIHATLSYHLPCHLAALQVGTPGEHLARLIPGLIVQRVEKGCSGMAGTFGLSRDNFRNSVRAGWGLISAIRGGTSQAGVTECSTCKIQMEQGTRKPTVHPLKLLAQAYGLMPEDRDVLAAISEDLVVT